MARAKTSHIFIKKYLVGSRSFVSSLRRITVSRAFVYDLRCILHQISKVISKGYQQRPLFVLNGGFLPQTVFSVWTDFLKLRPPSSIYPRCWLMRFRLMRALSRPEFGLVRSRVMRSRLAAPPYLTS